MKPEVRRLAAKQRGNITRDQLRALGVTRDAVLRAVEDRRFVEQFRGVFFVGSGEISPVAYAQAALLASPPGSVLSHGTAGALHRIRETWPARPHVTSPDRNRTAPDGIELHRVRSLPPQHVMTRHGLRVTTPERTLVDLAEVLDEQALAQAVGQAEFRRLLRPGRLERTMTECRGRHGLRRLKDVVQPGPQPTLSEMERRFLALVRAAELPAPVVNRQLGGVRPDFRWPEQRLIVETDGWDGHGGRMARERDTVRDTRLQIEGYRVMRLTWRRLTGKPYAVVAQLAVLLAS